MKSLRRASLTIFVVLLCAVGARTQTVQKDYLTALEADKIRDAETPNERIKLFLQYADDRLKKFQYELEHPSASRHAEMLNYLMNSYVGCANVLLLLDSLLNQVAGVVHAADVGVHQIVEHFCVAASRGVLQLVLEFLETIVGILQKKLDALVGSFGVADFVGLERGQVVFLNCLSVRGRNHE